MEGKGGGEEGEEGEEGKEGKEDIELRGRGKDGSIYVRRRRGNVIDLNALSASIKFSINK